MDIVECHENLCHQLESKFYLVRGRKSSCNEQSEEIPYAAIS